MAVGEAWSRTDKIQGSSAQRSQGSSLAPNLLLTTLAAIELVLALTMILIIVHLPRLSELDLTRPAHPR